MEPLRMGSSLGPRLLSQFSYGRRPKSVNQWGQGDTCVVWAALGWVGGGGLTMHMTDRHVRAFVAYEYLKWGHMKDQLFHAGP